MGGFGRQRCNTDTAMGVVGSNVGASERVQSTLSLYASSDSCLGPEWGGGASNGAPEDCCCICSISAGMRRDSHLKCGEPLKSCICHVGMRVL